LRYDAPAGNGTTTIRVWERGAAVTVVATYGLDADEVDAVVDSIDEEVM
jgi:coenzyme F420-reducing hydrogenase beta subunit